MFNIDHLPVENELFEGELTPPPNIKLKNKKLDLNTVPRALPSLTTVGMADIPKTPKGILSPAFSPKKKKRKKKKKKKTIKKKADNSPLSLAVQTGVPPPSKLFPPPITQKPYISSEIGNFYPAFPDFTVTQTEKSRIIQRAPFCYTNTTLPAVPIFHRLPTIPPEMPEKSSVIPVSVTHKKQKKKKKKKKKKKEKNTSSDTISRMLPSNVVSVSYVPEEISATQKRKKKKKKKKQKLQPEYTIKRWNAQTESYDLYTLTNKNVGFNF